MNSEHTGEIQVLCPYTHENYVITDPRLVCPVCGEVHRPEYYRFWFGNTEARVASGRYFSRPSFQRS